MPELIDTHVHLDSPRLSSKLNEVLVYAQEMGVNKMINIGHSVDSSLASLELAKAYDNIWAALGIHPHSAQGVTDSDLQQLKELAAHPKVVAIGEIGLDYHYDYSPPPVQRQVFRRQLELARDLALPIAIHQREAVGDAMEILRELGPFPHGGVMHCFSGSLETMAQCIDLNLHIGLGGPVTFTNARRVKEVAKAVPLNRLLLETDCPYLAPHPHRGKTNQPGYLLLVAQEISKLRSVSLEELAFACTTNANALFEL